jgi:dihydrolipoamide dehydrogenase
MQFSMKGIYAIEDVTSKNLLAHVSSAQGMVASANAAGQNRKMDYSIVPGCIYTSPEIAAVGLSEEEALQKGYKIKMGRFPVSANGKSMIMGEKEGITKIVADETSEEILETHIMSPRATDMIAEMSAAMKLEATIEEIAGTIHPHPTISEILMETAHDVEGHCIHKP